MSSKRQTNSCSSLLSMAGAVCSARHWQKLYSVDRGDRLRTCWHAHITIHYHYQSLGQHCIMCDNWLLQLGDGELRTRGLTTWWQHPISEELCRVR